MPEVKGKWIVVDNDIYQRLKDIGQPGETFSVTIRGLIEAYEAQANPKEQ